MITLDRPCIVEGKYDKITLSNFVKGIIITTNGFGIHRDAEKKALIQKYAQKTGLIILTDSDSAGMQIRNYIRSICNSDNIINVYIPQLKGKEKRKRNPSGEGYLGVEGMSEAIITDAFYRYGVLTPKNRTNTHIITTADLYELGLAGGNNSVEKRRRLCKKLNIPDNLSTRALLEVLNTFYKKDDFMNQKF